MQLIIFIIYIISALFLNPTVLEISHIDLQGDNVKIEINMSKKTQTIKTKLDETITEEVPLEEILSETSIDSLKKESTNTESSIVKKALIKLNQCTSLNQDDTKLLSNIQKEYEKGNYQTCLIMISTAPPSLTKCEKN